MRITGGIARGRRLAPIKTELIRPTSDLVREALFNILGPRVGGSLVLDLFAGSGAIGIEALSRGAGFALFVDQSQDAGRLIETNLRKCLDHPRAAFALRNLATTQPLAPLMELVPGRRPFDLVFMDPPYEKNLAQQVLAMVEKGDILAVDGLVIAEEHRRVPLPAEIGVLQVFDQRQYGTTGLWFYRRQPAEPPKDHE